jgi:hypothetical protein
VKIILGEKLFLEDRPTTLGQCKGKIIRNRETGQLFLIGEPGTLVNTTEPIWRFIRPSPNWRTPLMTTRLNNKRNGAMVERAIDGALPVGSVGFTWSDTPIGKDYDIYDWEIEE